jgi:hypothetical protein
MTNDEAADYLVHVAKVYARLVAMKEFKRDCIVVGAMMLLLLII